MKKKIIIALISLILIAGTLTVYAINKDDEGTQSSETSTDIVATETETTGSDEEGVKVEENKEASTLNEAAVESSNNVETNQGGANTTTQETSKEYNCSNTCSRGN